MTGYIETAERLKGFQELLEYHKKNISPIRVTSTAESQKVHLAFSLCRSLGKGLLYICADPISASLVAEDMSFFTEEENILNYPAREYRFYRIEADSNNSTKERINTLNSLVYSKEKKFIISTIEAVSQKIVSKDSFINSTFLFREGLVYEISSIIERLTKFGYRREHEVEGKGQFAVRGGILDIYPFTGEVAYRIEFFDEEIESVRKIDPSTQRSIERVKEVTVTPASEDFAVRENLILDYLKDYIIILDEPHQCIQSYENATKDLADSITSALEKEYKLSKKQKEISYYMESYSKITETDIFTVGFSNLTISAKGLYPKAQISIPAKSMPVYNGDFALLCDDLEFYLRKGYGVLFPCGNEVRAKQLISQFVSNSIIATFEKELKKPPGEGQVTLVEKNLRNGFEYPEIKIAVISDRAIASQVAPKKKPIKPKGNIRSISDINEGDFVVHRYHGIGIYKGIHQLVIDNVTKDYLKIKYKGNDVLYVPVNQLDLISKYIGAEDGIKVNKLGTTEWAAAKTKVRKSLEILAQELIDLYAKRQQEKGFAFGVDTDMQAEFEKTFAYVETDDQLKAIKSVKYDMQSDRPMDRLICGDVGYGKTEVAIRAAFKAVMDSKQVAYLVPTTLLAQQQYESFVSRMKEFPVKVEMLSRFRNKKQQNKVVEELKRGSIDIVIGTHRIIQDDVKFKDLGLLIIDEEQRFGVKHKEKIKALKTNVDVLTLSATPIPRTLNMAMNGLRDMSVLNDPPEDRHPVQTYVMEYNSEAIKTAITREMSRGGQVYYLHNRVETLDSVYGKIKKLVPEARIAVAHGKMSETELETVMLSVLKREYDILLCTTIIETGLDMPNINTIIIEDADKFGLSQLYQLRGRVGRSSRLAYAYLTVRRDKIIDEVAEKRLKAIKEFTEFGSGIKIAMRDLEIRGAGSVLGTRQHGHINQVGYELYCDLLKEAVDKIKNNSDPQIETPITIDLSINCFIPETYIADRKTRIDVYKAIACVTTEEDAEDIKTEIKDRFGNLPTAVENLIESALIKELAKKLSVSDIVQKGETILFKLTENSPMQKFVDFVAKNRTKYYFSNSKNGITLIFKPTKMIKSEILSNIKSMLETINL